VLKIIKFFFFSFLLLIVGLTLFINFGAIPDVKVVSGNELQESVKEELVEIGVIGEKEEIKYFYSEDLFSFVDYGNLFTQDRVVSYELDLETNERRIYSASYNEISHIEFEKGEGALEDSIIDIYVDGEHRFSLVVSQEEGGDKVFHEALVKKWKSIAK
jgi:hypothetical protein